MTGDRTAIGGTTVTFHPAGHVLGSAQVRVEVDGEVWVASGDYKRQHDPTCAAINGSAQLRDVVADLHERRRVEHSHHRGAGLREHDLRGSSSASQMRSKTRFLDVTDSTFGSS